MIFKYFPYLRRHWYITLISCVGLAFVVLFQLQRAPRIFNGLWGDEICYNRVILASDPSPHALSKMACEFIRPILDLSIKKFFWFQIFTPTEAGFSLIPWIYSGLTLLIILFVPWTRFVELRVLGVMMLGACHMEYAYSAEAHSYAFIGLGSWIFLLTQGWVLFELMQGRLKWAFWILLISFAIGLNTHFMAWPFIFLVTGVSLTSFLFSATDADLQDWAWKLFIGMGTVLASTVIINMYPLYVLLFATPSRTAEFNFRWALSFERLMTDWKRTHIPLIIYMIGLFVSLVHPVKWKRVWAWAIAIAAGPALFLTVFFAAGISDKTIEQKYTFHYLAPIFLGFLIGLDSIAQWIYRWRKEWTRAFNISCVVGVFLILGFRLNSLPIDAIEGWNAITSQKMNYTPDFRFFETVKSFRKPTLVLNSQCWLSTIPDLYMRFLGTKVGSTPLFIYNTTGCETPPQVLASGIDSFLKEYNDNGVVAVYLFPYCGVEPASPCNEEIPTLYKWFNPAKKECYAIYKAADIGPWLRRAHVRSSTSHPPMTAPERDRKTIIFRKHIAPVLFYLVPGCLIGFFLWVMRRHKSNEDHKKEIQ